MASYAFYDVSTGKTTPPIRRTVTPHILYNAGRVTTYALIGAVMGLTGSAANVRGHISGYQNIVSLAAGIIMILMGVSITGIWGTMARIEKRNMSILNTGNRVLQSPSVFKFYPLGFILGLLPCGLSYSAFIASAGTGNPLSGFLVSLLFGLRTISSLVLFGLAASCISLKQRGLLYRAAGVMIILTRIYYLIRGSSLGMHMRSLLI